MADLTPARTETQLTGAIDQILAQLPIEGDEQALEAEIAPLIAMGEEVLAGGDAARAASIFRQICDMAPEDMEALGGLVRALVSAGEVGEARTLIEAVPDGSANDAAIARARAALALVEAAPAEGDEAALRARIERDGDDHEARYELAGALMARGARDEAADALLEIVRRDREWNGGAARARLLQFIELVGLEDPWASMQRRRLSAILFT